MNEIIYKGVKIESKKCQYFQVKEGNTCSLVEDEKLSTITLTYVPGSTSRSLSNILGLKCYGKDIEITPMPLPKKFKSVTVSLNGLRFKKLTYDIHTINIIIVSDSESRVSQDYYHTTIVISKEDCNNQEFINYLFFSGNLIYFTPIGKKPECYNIKNFPKIQILDDSIDLVSDSSTVYNLRRDYNDYVIRDIDYQDQFILEVRKILENYGLELVRINRETSLTKTSYVTYQIIQTPVPVHHPSYFDPDNKLIQNKLPIEFCLRCTDMIMFFDFKKKYQNVDLLTNFCEFKTTDKYGDRWTAAIKWGSITEDFNHLYQQDDNSNFSYQCQFRCEIYFYEVIDDRFKFLEEILTNLENIDI